MSKKEVKDETLELIRLVDKDFRNNSFYFLVSLEFGGPLLLFLFVWGFFALYIRSLGPGNLPIPTLLTLTISLLALFFSISAQLDTQRNRLVIARNYYLISRHFSDKTTTEKLHILWEPIHNYLHRIRADPIKKNPLLKAIIKVKAENPDILLESEYQDGCWSLNEKKLLENLLYS